MTKKTQPVSQVNDYLTGLARTVVPMVVGLVVSLALYFGVSLPAGLVAPLTSAVSAGYYAAVHYVERFIDPRAGWLLGVAKVATYPPSAGQRRV